MSKNLPKNWSKIKRKWIEKNPPDSEGNYTCGLCKRKVPAIGMSLDHILPLETYIEYASELSNLRPTHAFCNQERAFPTLKMLRGRKTIGITSHRGGKRR